jgi:Tfp pilus assembly protein PilV
MNDIYKKINSAQSGFTLIETIIYIALFALIISGAVVSVYSIMGSNARNQTKAMVEEEGNFLVGKIDWMFNEKQNISIDHTGTAWTLIMARIDGTNEAKIKIDNGKMQIDEGTGYLDLNNSNIIVTCPSDCFFHTVSTGNGINPESIEADITVSTKTSEGLPYSQEFSTVKYLRK